MGTGGPTCELHLRLLGQATTLMLRLHGDPPSEGDVAAWMQEGSVVRFEVSEAGSRHTHGMLVNFRSVVLAWLAPLEPGRGVRI
jgi:hypothetical protein